MIRKSAARLRSVVIEQLEQRRLLTAAALDLSFNGTGPGYWRGTIGGGSGDDAAESLLIQPDGKILAAGFTTINGSPRYYVARFNRSGSLDTSFGSNGVTLLSANGSADVGGIAFLSSGQIVLAGSEIVGNASGLAVYELNGNGSPLGFFKQNVGSGSFFARSVLPDPISGGFYVGGSEFPPGSTDGDIAVMRFNASLQTDFGFASGLFVSSESGNFGANGLALFGNAGTGNRSLYVVGGSTLLKLDSGSGSVQATTHYNFTGNALVAQPDGKLVVAGATSAGGFAVGRFTSSGATLAADPTFGSGGTTIDSTASYTGGWNSIRLQSDGKIMAGGRFNSATQTNNFAVRRYTAAGAVDTTFSTYAPFGGSVIEFGGNDSIASIAIDDDGKVVVAGTVADGGEFPVRDSVVARYSIDQYPYKGVPYVLPALIEAEDFDNGGEGVSYHDADPGEDSGGGYRGGTAVDIGPLTAAYAVGYVNPGETLSYTISVPTAGDYILAARVANAGAGGQFHVEVNGVNKTGTLTVPNTGAWPNYTTIQSNSFNLSAAATATLKIVFDTNSTAGAVADVDWIRLTPVPSSARTLIDFESPAAGDHLHTQYEQSGVTFSDALVYTAPGTDAESPTKAAQLWDGGEVPLPATVGTFNTLANEVMAYVGLVDTSAWHSTTVTLTGYDTAGNVVATRTVPVSGAGIHTPVRIVTATPVIASFRLQGPDQALAMDDLSFVAPANQPPAFALQVGGQQTNLTASIDVAPGTSNTISVNTRALNGSSGNLGFRVTGLPSGVTAQFAPPIAAVGTPSILTLTAASGMAENTYNLLVTAAPQSPSVGARAQSVPLTLHIHKNFAIGTEKPDVSVYSSKQVRVILSRDMSATQVFGGPATLSVLNPNNYPFTFSFSPATLTGNDFVNFGAYAYSNLTVTATGPIESRDYYFIIQAQAGQQFEYTTLVVHRVPGIIDSVTPNQGKTPQMLQPGTLISIKGEGLSTGSTVQFGVGGDQVTPEYFASDGTELRVRLSRYAESGIITIRKPGPFTIKSAGNFSVDSFRNTSGLSRVNDIQDGEFPTTFGDMEELFGYDQTHAHINIPIIPPFWYYSVTIPAHSPFAEAWLSALNGQMDDGQCFGFALTADRFIGGQANVLDYPVLYPTVAPVPPTVWWLDASTNDTKLMHYVHLQHMSQFSQEAIFSFLGQAASHLTDNSAALYDQLSNMMQRGEHPLVCMRTGAGASDEGHCVLAYDLEGSRTGDFYIDVYDPNRPYDPSPPNPLKNPSGGRDWTTNHAATLAVSRIKVQTNGLWRFTGDFAGPNDDWAGGFDTLTFTSPNAIPVHPTLSGRGAADVLFPFSGATVSQVADSSGHYLLNGDGTENTNPATRLPGAAVIKADLSATGPAYAVTGGTAITETLLGTGGNYHQEYLGGAGTFAARVLDTTLGAGDKDTLTLDSSHSSFNITTSGPAKSITGVVDAADATDSNGTERSATFKLNTFTNAGDTIAFNALRDNVVLTHTGGATSCAMTLSQGDGAGVTQTFSTGLIQLAQGDTATFVPSNWDDLTDATVTMTVRDRFGVTTSTTLTNHADGTDLSTSEGAVMTVPVATFSAPAGTYQAIVDWGDGSAATPAIVSGANGNYTVTGTHTYLNEGTYYPKISIGGGALSEIVYSTARVANVPLAVRGRDAICLAGSSFSGRVATFTDVNSDADPSSDSATIDWGDNQTSPGVITKLADGSFAVSGSHSYTTQNANGYVVSVRVAENDGFVASGAPFDTSGGSTLNGAIAGIAAPVPGSTASDYAVTIDWGDGTNSPGTRTLGSDGQLSIGGNHTYSSSGTFTPRAFITYSAPVVAPARVTFFSLTSPVHTQTGPTARAITTGDFNADGIADIAWVTTSTGGVLLGLGDGTFAHGGTFSFSGSGQVPADIVASDFNADGKLDLAFGANQVRVYPGLGNGSFGTAVTVGGSGAVGLVAGDFNGDGKADLAAPQSTTGTVAVYTNLTSSAGATPQFSLVASYVVGRSPGDIAAADLNSDGRADLLVTNDGGHDPADIADLTVLLNAGAGNFTPVTDVLIDKGPLKLATGDVNGDGVCDAVVSQTTGNSVAVLIGDGSGGFDAPSIFQGGAAPTALALADFDGDGQLDIVTSNSTGAVTVLAGHGDGTFGTAGSFQATDPSFAALAVTTGDFNRDGRLDVAAAGSDVAVLLSKQPAPFATSASFKFDGVSRQAVQLAFSTDVRASVANTDLVVQNLTTGLTIDSASIGVAYDPATNVATFTFPGFTRGVLPDGNYMVTLPAGNVSDGAGVPMAAPVTLQFFVLAADANHDRHVDATDQAILTANLGHSAPTFSQGDFNYDGAVDGADQALLNANLLYWLPPQGPLTLPSTSANDNIRLRRESTSVVEVRAGGIVTYRIPLGAIVAGGLTFAGGAGDDTLTVDFSNGAPFAGASMAYFGNGGTDTLSIVGSATSSDAAAFAATSASLAGAAVNENGVEAAVFDGAGGWDNVTISGGPPVKFVGTQRFESLNIAAGASASVASGGQNVLVVHSLAVAGRLDLADNDLILNYPDGASPAGTWTGNAYDGVTGLIAAGRKSGNGPGIVTSSASPNGLTTLGLAEASLALHLTGAQTAVFDGESVDATTVLVKYTYAGDANLDGKINVDDYGRIDSSIRSGLTGWYNGDFNYDGKINVDDYGIIDFNVGIQGPPL